MNVRVAGAVLLICCAAPVAVAQTLYSATTGSGSLYRINPANGSAALIGPLRNGSNQAFGLSGLAANGAGEMYGTSSADSPTSPNNLVRVDPATGVVTVIGPLNLPVPGGPVGDLTFLTTGRLFGFAPVVGAYVLIDLATGAATVQGTAGKSVGGLATSPVAITTGITVNPVGSVFGVSASSQTTPQERRVNPATGVETVLNSLTGAPCCTFSALEFSAAGTLYGIIQTAGVPSLVIVAATTGAVTTLGALPSLSTALTFGPTSSITVSVAPATALLSGGQTQQFTATVTSAFNPAVTWSVTPSVGSISGTGLYTAPATVTVSETVTVTATSIEDPSKTGTATITLSPLAPPSVPAPATSLLVLTGLGAVILYKMRRKPAQS